MTFSLLTTINSPQDLKHLSLEQLLVLKQQLRDFILKSVSETGGHLSSNLGVVELTIALHYVFNTPSDKLIWDVGHQSYAHKILTGRRAQMAQLRKYQGLAGFPMRSESQYDAFGTAHSSTSISAALGMAMAAKLQHQDYYSIAVIGDGAMSAGMAFEALNNAGVEQNAKLLVILNDNKMSISPPVGALNSYLVKLLSDSLFLTTKKIGEEVLSIAPPLAEIAKKIKKTGKSMLAPATIFETLGFHYIGPVDGHDLPTLIKVLESIKKFSGPQLLHVITKKGCGYKLAERDPITYHGLSSFNPAVGVNNSAHQEATFSAVFGAWLCRMASQDERLIGITPAMREGSGMVKFQQQFPNRYFDVGIAEQHAVTFAAGLACAGLKPVVAIYSTFLQRAYDQLIHDVALQKLPVVFAVDRAGLVGADGATHNGSFDIAFARCIPNLAIACPSDENECSQLLTTAYRQDYPVLVRYPRGAGTGQTVSKELTELPLGKGVVKRQGKEVVFFAFGTLVHEVLSFADKLDATVVDMRWAKPLDEQLLQELAKQHKYLVSVEEGCKAGGAGSAIAEYFTQQSIKADLLILGIEDEFIEHGDLTTLLSIQNLTAPKMLAQIWRRWPELKNGVEN